MRKVFRPKGVFVAKATDLDFHQFFYLKKEKTFIKNFFVKVYKIKEFTLLYGIYYIQAGGRDKFTHLSSGTNIGNIFAH